MKSWHGWPENFQKSDGLIAACLVHKVILTSKFDWVYPSNARGGGDEDLLPCDIHNNWVFALQRRN